MMKKYFESLIVGQIIAESPRQVIFEARRENSFESYIIKLLKEDFADEAGVASIENEFAILSAINQPDVIKVHEIGHFNTSRYLVLESFSNQTLKYFIETQRYTLKTALEIAIEIAKALLQVHQSHIIHKDIKPTNILINENNKIKIIDFSLSVDMNNSALNQKLNSFEGTVEYVSPEQTGRANIHIDQRTDIYSFGVVLYLLFTKQLPFKGERPAQIIHKHLSLLPPNLCEIDETIPEVINNIVLKCLQKNPNERYQNVAGLQHDLQMCLDSLNQRGHVEYFNIGQHDSSANFQLPVQLYGRSREMKLILELFNESCNGAVRLLKLRGYSGVGKSSLLKACRKSMQAANIAIVEFEHTANPDPMYGIKQIFNQLIHQIMTFDEDNINAFKNSLENQIGDNLGVLTELIPELSQLVGEKPTPIKLFPEESQNRLLYNISLFMKIILDFSKPLVLLIDDMQWIDRSSLHFITYLFLDIKLHHLFVIFSYRDNEIHKRHPVFIAFDEMQEGGALVMDLEIKNLDNTAASEIIADICDGMRENDIANLVDILLKKTQGNPFFIIQCMRYLYDNQYIQYDYNEKKWVKNNIDEKTLGISENVADLLIGNIEKLDKDLLLTLQYCSIIGRTIDESLLVQLNFVNTNKITGIIQSAIEKGFLYQTELEIRFVHDKTMQAFFESIEKNKIAEMNIKIGFAMIKIYDKDYYASNKIIQIADHLNYHQDKKVSNDENEIIYDINIRAASLLKDTLSFEKSIELLKIAQIYQKETYWYDKYQQTWNLYQTLAIDYHQIGEINVALTTFKYCIDNTKSIDQKIELYIEVIFLLTQTQDFKQIDDFAIEVLNSLNYSFKMQPNKIQILISFLVLQFKLKRRLSSLLDLPIATDKRMIQVSRLLAALAQPSFKSGNKLRWLQIAIDLINITLKFGITPSSPGGLGGYAMFLGSEKINQPEFSYQVGALGYAMSKNLAKTQESNIARFIYAYFIHKWHYDIRLAIEILWEAYREGLSQGTIGYSATALMSIILIKMLVGSKVDTMITEISDAMKEMKKITALAEERSLAVFREFCLCLQGKATNSIICEPDEILPFIQQEQSSGKLIDNELSMVKYHIWQGLLWYIFGEYQKVQDLCVFFLSADSYTGLLDLPIAYCYYALSLARLYDHDNDKEKIKTIKKLSKQLNIWANVADVNYGVYACLVNAEICRINKHFDKAEVEYNRAIEFAKNQENHLLLAISFEILSRFYELRGNNEIASFFIKKSYHHFAYMGADAKCDAIRKNYFELLSADEFRVLSASLEDSSSKSKSTTSTTNIDVDALLAFSEAFSNEIVFDKLISALIQALIINAGADKAVLMLYENNELSVLAQYSSGTTNLYLKNPLKLQDIKDIVSLQTINYTRHSKQYVLINAITHQELIQSDPYLLSRKSSSILCLPLILKSNLRGVLYLENSENSTAFSPKLCEMLHLLSTQMIISIENAQFYAKLEEKVEDRTKLLVMKNDALEAANKHIQQVQKEMLQQEKLASLGFISTRISHELRNPLNFVINFILIIREQFDEIKNKLFLAQQDTISGLLDEVDNNINIIEKHATTSNNIVNNMISHANEGAQTRSIVDVNKALKYAVTTANEQFQKKHSGYTVIIDYDMCNNNPTIVAFDADLHRAIFNIITNALDAMYLKQKKDTKNYQPKLQIKSLYDKVSVKIIIRDNGIGISEDILGHVYEPFFTTKPTGYGTGLGLSMAHDIVKMQHDGTIEMNSLIDEFTEVIITLPIPTT